MSLFEMTGAAALSRGSPHTSHSAHAARSSAQRAQDLQGVATAAAAAPVETVRAIVQIQASEKTLIKPERPRAESTARKAAQPAPSSQMIRPNPSLAKPMTAMLLHELRLQQELADVRDEVSGKRP